MGDGVDILNMGTRGLRDQNVLVLRWVTCKELCVGVPA